MRRFLPWMVKNLSTFLAGRPLARQRGQQAGTDPHEPQPLCTSFTQSWGSSQSCPALWGRWEPPSSHISRQKTHAIPTKEEKKEKGNFPLPSANSSPSFRSKTRSPNAMKNGKNTSSGISQADRRDLRFRSSQLLPFTADKIQPHPEHEQIPRCSGEAQCKALEAPADAGRRRKKETSKPRELVGKSMMRRQHFEFTSDTVKALEENGIWSSARQFLSRNLQNACPASLDSAQTWFPLSSNNFF